MSITHTPNTNPATLKRACADVNNLSGLSCSAETKLPTIKFDKHKTQAECAVCSALQILINRAQHARINKGDAAKKLKILKEKYDLHHTLARLEKLSEYVRESQGRAKKGHLAGAWDGFDNFKTQCFTLKGKSMGDMKGIGGSGANGAGYKFKTQGVLLYGWGYYLYVCDPRISSNANFNIECFHRTLHKFFDNLMKTPDAQWPETLTIQVDGASDNKCKTLFMYAEYLIRIGLFDVVMISFLIVGHTHNKMDQKFVPLTFELRRGVVKKLDDLLKNFKTAYKEEQPQCIEVVKSVADYTTWLLGVAKGTFGGFARRVPDQHRPHQFIITRCTPTPQAPDGVRFDYKNLSVDSSYWNRGQSTIVLLSDLPNGNGPRMQTPLNHAAQHQHIVQLGTQREGVFQLMNAPNIKESFTHEDRKYSGDLFDSFCEKDGTVGDLEKSVFINEIKNDFGVWKTLPHRSRVTKEVHREHHHMHH